MNGHSLTYTSSDASRPRPSVWQERRNGLLAAAVILLALAMGWQLKEYVLNQMVRVQPAPSLPILSYPLTWRVGEFDNLAFQAINPHSSELFASRLELRAQPLTDATSLQLQAAQWSFRQEQTMDNYRLLNTASALGPGGRPAVINSYAYVAKPVPSTSSAVSLPVVVRAQDVIFVYDVGGVEQLVIVTVAADADAWEAELPTFRRILQALAEPS